MAGINFDRGLAIAGFILAIVVLDPAGQLRGPVLFGLLAVAAAMTLPLVFSVPWVAGKSGPELFARRALMVCLVGVAYSLVCVWITGNISRLRSQEAPKIPANLPLSSPAAPPVAPAQPQPITQTATDSDCSNLVAESGSQIKCEAERKSNAKGESTR
jgi:hypothetical protein